MHRLPEMAEQGKALLMRPAAREGAVIAIIVLVGFGGFGFGYLAGSDRTAVPMAVLRASSSPSVEALRRHMATPAGLVVASENGSSYHYPWCGSAQRIHAENMIWYTGTSAAAADGYEPAQNCPGLR